MKQVPLWPFFCIALFFALFATALVPEFTFFPFVPFLVMAFDRYELPKALWIAAGCGIILDFLSADIPFGLHALNHALITFFIHRFRHFFVEKALGLCSYTAIFSLLSTTLARCLFVLFGIHLPMTWQGLGTDFILMPLIDGFYAFLWFYCPLVLYNFLRRQWFRFLFFREQSKKGENDPVKN